jgi:hypothetical protein
VTWIEDCRASCVAVGLRATARVDEAHVYWRHRLGGMRAIEALRIARTRVSWQYRLGRALASVGEHFHREAAARAAARRWDEWNAEQKKRQKSIRFIDEVG